MEETLRLLILKRIREAQDAEMLALYRAAHPGFLICPIAPHGVHVWDEMSQSCTACGTTAKQIAELAPR